MNSATFTFDDGITSRSVDPLTVLRRLSECPHYCPAMIDAAINANATAIMLVSEFVRFAFGVKLLAEHPRGLTRLDCVLLLHQFERWIASLRKSQ